MTTQDDWMAETEGTGPHSAPAAPTPAAPTPAAPTPAAPTPAAPTPGAARALAPPTGDPAIDAALAELDAVDGEPLARHIVAGERVHQVLQARLSDLGGA